MKQLIMVSYSLNTSPFNGTFPVSPLLGDVSVWSRTPPPLSRLLRTSLSSEVFGWSRTPVLGNPPRSDVRGFSLNCSSGSEQLILLGIREDKVPSGSRVRQYVKQI